MAITNIDISVEEVKNLVKLGEVGIVEKILNDLLIKFELNIVQNNYTYEYLRFFLDYLMLPELCEDTMPKEECVKEAINLIDYFRFDSWFKWQTTKIITNRINIIGGLFTFKSIDH